MTDVMYLPGVNGHYASTPDSAALSVTGDIDIRCKIAMDDWTPASQPFLLTKYLVAGGNRSWFLEVISAGNLNLVWSVDGTATINKASTVPTGISDGAVKWVRATLDVDNGASGNAVKFYTSDDGSSWAQLGTTVTTAGVTSIFDGTAGVNAGGYDAGVTPPAGRYYRAQIRNNILDDGTGIVFDADFTDRGNTFIEDSSNHATVTIWGRLQGYQPTWLPAEALYGVANHYGYEMKKLDAHEPAPKTTFPSATGGTTYPVAR